jgi:hypothetical protein
MDKAPIIGTTFIPLTDSDFCRGCEQIVWENATESQRDADHDYYINHCEKLLDLEKTQCEALCSAYQSEIDRLKQALDDDAADLWRVTNAIKKEIRDREWIMEGRGCYSWDDNRYKDETRLAFEAVMKLISDVQHPAQKRFNSVMERK